MNRYALYIFDEYYPDGGAKDFVSSSNDIEDLKSLGDELLKSESLGIEKYANIFDRKLEKLILENYWNAWRPYVRRK